MAHVGVVRALERLRLVPDEIVGTGFGAVIGAGLAAGMSSSELESLARGLQLEEHLRNDALRVLVQGAQGAAENRGRRYREQLQAHLPADFAQLGRPFLCNALSLSSGDVRTFGLPALQAVPLVDAVYASSCMPGVFAPCRIDGEMFVDGAMAESLPLRLAESRRPDLILAVDVAAPRTGFRADPGQDPASVLYRSYEILGSVVAEHTLHRYANRSDVVLIKPRMAELDLACDADSTELMARGERDACRALACHPETRYLCDPELIKSVDREIGEPRDYVRLDVDPDKCINCGLCAVTCVTDGYAAVPMGNVVRKLHHYECARDGACERSCPSGAITLRY